MSNPASPIRKEIVYYATCDGCGVEWIYEDCTTLKELCSAVSDEGAMLVKEDGKWHFTCGDCAAWKARTIRFDLTGTPAAAVARKLTYEELEAIVKATQS